MVIFVLITSYMIQTQNDEEILILYLDYSTEFGIDLKNFHIHNNMKKIIYFLKKLLYLVILIKIF